MSKGSAGDNNAMGEGLSGDGDAAGEGPVGDSDAVGKGPTGDHPGAAACCLDAGPRFSVPARLLLLVRSQSPVR